MSTYKKSIGDLERLLDENHKSLQSRYELLGARLVELDSADLKQSPYADRIARIGELLEQIAGKERTILEWDELSDELDSINEAISQIDADCTAKVDEIETHYESIGRAALDTYLSDPDAYQNVAEAVEGVVAIDENIRDKEQELRTLETTDRAESFFGKTLARGKGMVLRGSLKSKGLQRGRAFREAGRRICLDGPMPEVEQGSPLSQALHPVRPLLEELGGLRREREQLEQNRIEVEKRRLEIEKRERMRNPAKNLAHGVERLRVEVAELSTELGAAYAEENASDKVEDESIKTVMESIARLNDINGAGQKLIARLRAAADVERLDSEIESRKKNLERLEREIATVHDAVKNLQAEKVGRVKARGNVSSLDAEVKKLIRATDSPPEAAS